MNDDRVRDLIGEVAKQGERIPLSLSSEEVRRGVNTMAFDEPNRARVSRPVVSGWRKRIGPIAAIAVLIAVALPVVAAIVFVAVPLSTHSHSQAAASSTTSPPTSRPNPSTTITQPPPSDRGSSAAAIAVGRAVGTTDSSSNFDLSFVLSGGSDLDTSGLSSSGVVDLSPTFAMNLSDVVGASLYFGEDNAWEVLGGQVNEFTLPGFSAFAENAAGDNAGALSTFAFCSPTGLFDLTQNEIGATTLVGPAIVNGIATTEYAVSIDPTTFLDAPGITSGEQQAMQGAIDMLQGGTISDDVYIDSTGDVVQTVSAIDGATFQVDLSNFGNAGTVTLPPQQSTINSNTNTSPSVNTNTCDSGSAQSGAPSTTIPGPGSLTTVTTECVDGSYVGAATRSIATTTTTTGDG